MRAAQHLVIYDRLFPQVRVHNVADTESLAVIRLRGLQNIELRYRDRRQITGDHAFNEYASR